MEWYYVGMDDSSNGPVSEAELKRLWGVKQIDDETAVWNESMSDWKEIKLLPDLKRKLAPPPPKRMPPRGPPARG